MSVAPQEMIALRDTVRAGQSALWVNPAYMPAADPVARADLDRACDDWAMLARCWRGCSLNWRRRAGASPRS